MTVVITWSDGNSTRRCDGKCHNAKGDRCNCICGGRNHGVGEVQAIRNAREDVEDVLNAEGFSLRPLQLTLELDPEVRSKVDNPVPLWEIVETDQIPAGGVV